MILDSHWRREKGTDTQEAHSTPHFSNFPRAFTSVALLVISFAVYMGNGRVIGSGDTLPARYLPIGILCHFTFYLDDFPALYDARAMKRYSFGESKPYYLRIRKGHYISQYPPGPALLALPIYVAPVLGGMRGDSRWLPDLEKLSASVITAFSVLFLFWALRELVTERWAIGIAAIYAFGTSSLSVSSQAMWQHGPSQFFVALALYFLTKGRHDDNYLGYAGFALGTSAIMRPTDVLIAAPIALWVVRKRRSALAKFTLFALPPLAFMLVYNAVFLGSIVGFHTAQDPRAWQMPLLKGLAGLLLSPARGLFVYSPIVLFSCVGMYRGWRSRDPFLKYLSLAPVLVVLLYSKWFMWWGGYSYGPRMLADLFPILCFFLYPVVDYICNRRVLVGAFALLALMSIGTHVLGAYYDDGLWNSSPDVNENQYRLWTWHNSPIVYCTRLAYYRAGDLYHKLRN
jgi:hypothetical protein